MREASLTYHQPTLPGILNATFSQGSAAGQLPCGKQDGPMKSRCGQDLAHVSRFPVQDSAKALRTSATSGLSSSGSFESAVLTRSLANKLRQKTDYLGSTLYALTWKERITPSGRLIYALRASVRRISDKDCTGWPTPVANPANGTPEAFLERKRKAVERGAKMGIVLSDIAMGAQLTGWPTPSATMVKGGYPEGRMRNRKISVDRLDVAVQIAGPARQTASGEILTGSSAGIENGGQLNPDLARWLMGFPIEHLSSGVTAMQSLSRKHKRS